MYRTAKAQDLPALTGLWQRAFGDPEEYAHKVMTEIAGLDNVRTMPSLFRGDLEKAREVYSWMVRACGNDLDKLLTRERIAQIVKEKAELQLFA